MKSNAENSLRCQADAPPAQIEVDEDEKKNTIDTWKDFLEDLVDTSMELLAKFSEIIDIFCR